jgi:hypothetical protein
MRGGLGQTWWVARLAAEDGKVIWFRKGPMPARPMAMSSITTLIVTRQGDLLAAGFTNDNLFARSGSGRAPGETDGFLLAVRNMAAHIKLCPMLRPKLLMVCVACRFMGRVLFCGAVRLTLWETIS